MDRLTRARHLQENLAPKAARGKEWATPGLVAALQRAVSGLDTGREAASPRAQTKLRRLAEDLGAGVERVRPRLQEGPGRVPPKTPRKTRAAVVPPLKQASQGQRRMLLLLCAVAALATAAVALRELLRGTGEEAAQTTEPEAGDSAEERAPRGDGVTAQSTPVSGASAQDAYL
ncbi:hypothetical protein [Pseudarthrobacter sp. NS4]|uniref:hypothetical protein n=1 Tax=Pseudarthrobacter sp. NS4 TaxID=2973976 RepID=UPI00216342EA|nr:hypothetical protein [Pseudarthrobacter sp. NS4]